MYGIDRIETVSEKEMMELCTMHTYSMYVLESTRVCMYIVDGCIHA